MADRQFYVAMSKKHPGRGRASCVADITDEFDATVVRDFLREYRRHEIRKVGHAEMARLMTVEPEIEAV